MVPFLAPRQSIPMLALKFLADDISWVLVGICYLTSHVYGRLSAGTLLYDAALLAK